MIAKIIQIIAITLDGKTMRITAQITDGPKAVLDKFVFIQLNPDDVTRIEQLRKLGAGD